MENGFERQMLVLAERTDMHWASAASVPESFTATTRVICDAFRRYAARDCCAP